MPGCEIELFTEGDVILPFDDINGDWILDRAEEIVKNLRLSAVTLTLVMTDNDYIRTINNNFRKKDKPTDVISFAYRENPFPGLPDELENLGDIYISLEKAKEQSVEYGVTLKEEVKRLLIHGILHLLGYDHEKGRKQAEEMRSKEDEIFASIGL